MSTASDVLETIDYLEELRGETPRPIDASLPLRERQANNRANLRLGASLSWAEQHLDECRAALPYRPRVEVIPIATLDDVCYAAWGRWEDETLQYAGGGIDPGETAPEAALREMAEELRITAEKAVLVPGIHPMDVEWQPPYLTEAQRRRASRYRGSRTVFCAALFGAVAFLPVLCHPFAWHRLDVRPTNEAERSAHPDLSRARAIALDIVSRLHAIL